MSTKQDLRLVVEAVLATAEKNYVDNEDVFLSLEGYSAAMAGFNAVLVNQGEGENAGDYCWREWNAEEYAKPLREIVDFLWEHGWRANK